MHEKSKELWAKAGYKFSTSANNDAWIEFSESSDHRILGVQTVCVYKDGSFEGSCCSVHENDDPIEFTVEMTKALLQTLKEFGIIK